MHSFQRLTQLRDLLVVNQVYLHPGKARKVDNFSTFNELESLVHSQEDMPEKHRIRLYGC